MAYYPEASARATSPIGIGSIEKPGLGFSAGRRRVLSTRHHSACPLEKHNKERR